MRNYCKLFFLLLIINGCKKSSTTSAPTPPAPPPATAPQLQSNVSSILLGSSSGSKDSLTITSNIGWTLELSPATVAWTSLSATSGSNNAKIYVTATQENASGVQKAANIILTPVGSTAVQPVTISLKQDFKTLPPANGLIQWQKILGGSGNDFGNAIAASADGGYVVAGYSSSVDGDVTDSRGFADIWVVKLNNTGNMVWQKAYGGGDGDFGYSINATPDGGYILAGHTLSNNVDVSLNHGDYDIWVLKINGTGGIVWQKTYGGTKADRCRQIVNTPDGGFIVVGNTSSGDGDLSGNHSSSDGWVIKLSNTGDITWQKNLGGAGNEDLLSIVPTPDGNYLIAGSTSSSDGDVSSIHGGRDGWVMKLSGTGNIIWQKTIGGTADDNLSSIKPTPDGNYIVVGSTSSTDGDVTGNHGSSDGLIIKIDGTGNIIWKKIIGGSALEGFSSALINTQNELIVAGATQSNDGDVSGSKGGEDCWIVKLDAAGTILDKKLLGGSGTDFISDIVSTSDNAYIIVNTTNSTSGDVVGPKGGRDIWVVKFKFQ